MRIGGMEVKGLNEVMLVLSRTQGDVLITARAIPSYEEFEKLVPDPKMPVIITRDGTKNDDLNVDYLAAVARREQLRIAYIYIKSLEPSQIEWDTVKLDTPSTWMNFRKDFENAGLSPVEINRIWGAVSEANCLSEDKLEAARARFLLGAGTDQKKSSSPTTEPVNTQSGEPANDSASDPQG
jgi:hypothetical protein